MLTDLLRSRNGKSRHYSADLPGQVAGASIYSGEETIHIRQFIGFCARATFGLRY
jgi:hypothetical protein